MRAMTFPRDYIRPSSHQLTTHMAGNAVPPKAMCEVITALVASL
jgi:DNA (cytosine-5)-methyltransferase 1